MIVFLATVATWSLAAAANFNLQAQVCKALPEQRFAFGPLPSNLPPNDKPAGAQQISIANGFSSECTSMNPPQNSTNCVVNVKAWETSKGATVWATTSSPSEPVDHELNRVWVYRDDDGALFNPASKLCADFVGGISASPGAVLELRECDSTSQSSKWIYSTTDHTFSQAVHSGGYPGLCITASGTSPGPGPSPPAPPLPPQMNVVVELPDASNSTSSGRMASFNFDWHKDSEEPPKWINSSAMLIDLDSPMLRNAASSMSGSMLRLGGSEGDVVCYDVPEFNMTCEMMNQTDPAMCLSMTRYKELASFCNETGIHFVFGLNAMWGRKGLDPKNPLDTDMIEALLAYTAKYNIEIFGFELGNEKCGPPPNIFAADYHNVHNLLVKYWPDVATRPKLIGNDCNTDPGYLSSWLPLVADILDVTTYHHYDGYGLDPNLLKELMTPGFLDKTVSEQLNSVHAQFAPKSELWVGEAAAAWHSGADGITNAFASSFWWSDALGALSAHNHTGYCRQTLLGGDYGLLNRTNYEPNPDFYISKLFHDLMGNAVLQPEYNNTGEGWLRIYAHCSRDAPGVSTLVINLAPNTTFEINGASGYDISTRNEWMLTASGLHSRTIDLNGKELTVSDDHLPALNPKVQSGPLIMKPQSIAFFTIDARFTACSSA